MKKTLFFGTNNEHKLSEIQQLLGDTYEIRSFRDLSQPLEVDETERTLEGNAILKAKAFYAAIHLPCFADDTGLEVAALGGAPGVFSARYAGENATFQDNVTKLLRNLEEVDMGAWGRENRDAAFRTVIAFYDGTNLHTFSGEVRGTIANEPFGEGGFGYDPVFIPEGSEKTFAEMTAEEKNAISHRGIAVRNFVAFLKENR